MSDGNSRKAVAHINSRKVEIQSGETILEAAKRLGITIPTLCHDPDLSPIGGCRMCVVHSEHHDTPVGACHTPLEPGMDLQTHHVAVEKLRRSVLQLHLDSAAETGFDLGVTRSGPFWDLLEHYDIRGVRVEGHHQRDRSHAQLRFDPDACIGCRLCVTACDELAGQHVFEIDGRASETRVRTAAGRPLGESRCIACGACIDRCPTGAVIDRDRQALWVEEDERREVDSVCGLCSVGCRVRLEVIDDTIRRIDGIADETATNPGGLLCEKGRYDHLTEQSWERLSSPMLRQGAGFREVSWDDAYDFIESRLTTILGESGPESFGALASTRASTESNYLLQKFCRSVIRSPHIDSAARRHRGATFEALWESIGHGAATASFADIDRATCLIVSGADPDSTHPVLASRIKQAVADGARLVVIDPDLTPLAEIADLHLQAPSGADIALSHAVAFSLLESGKTDDKFLKTHAEGLHSFREFVRQFPLKPVAEWASLSAESLTGFVDLLAEHRGSTLFLPGPGLGKSASAKRAVQAFLNLAILTGNLGKSGAGFLPFGGRNNLQGCMDAGAAPDRLPGQVPIDDADARARFESQWGKPLPSGRGLTGPEMIDAAGCGELRALWVMGHDLKKAHPNKEHREKALEKLDLLVVQDLFFSRAARHADVLLPATGRFEQDGIYINAERRLQRVRAALSAPENARSDWAILGVMARRLGANWPVQDAEDIWAELTRVAPDLFGGIPRNRLAETPEGIQWPCPDLDHPGTATVLVQRARLVSVPVK